MLSLATSSVTRSNRPALARAFNSKAWLKPPGWTSSTPKTCPFREASSKILAADIMTPLARNECVALPPTASAFDAARAMHTNDVGSVVILNSSKKVCGIVTERDLLSKVLVHDMDPREMNIAKVMTPYPRCALATHTLDQLVDYMLASNCRHIPVLGDRKSSRSIFDMLRSWSVTSAASPPPMFDSLIGMVSIRDIADSLHQLYRTMNKDGNVHHHVVSELFAQPQPSVPSQSPVPSYNRYKRAPTYFAVRPSCTSSRALKMMTQRNLGALLVTDGNQPTGIVTERDFVRGCASGLLMDKDSCLSTPIGEFAAARALISVTGDYQVERCLSILAKNRFRHLPVFEFLGDSIDYDTRCSGIVSVRDLLRATYS